MIIHDGFKQGTPEWREMKRGLPSASNFGRILTPSKAQLSTSLDDYACELIAERYGLGDMDSTPVTAAMLHGTQTEPEARRLFEFDRACAIREVGGITNDAGTLWCSPDGLIVGEDAGLELKCPLPKTHIAWMLNGGLPLEHKAQTHGGMAVTGWDTWFFLSYVPGLPTYIVEVKRDDFTRKLEDALLFFTARYAEIVATLNLPEPVKTHPEIELPAAFAM